MGGRYVRETLDEAVLMPDNAAVVSGVFLGPSAEGDVSGSCRVWAAAGRTFRAPPGERRSSK